LFTQLKDALPEAQANKLTLQKVTSYHRSWEEDGPARPRTVRSIKKEGAIKVIGKAKELKGTSSVS